MLDLSKLEETPTELVLAKPTGEPLNILLSDIDEDPDQPRKEFTEKAMKEMIASVKERGVKTPVSVRAHPSKPGKWILNYGARRYRSSKAAGRETIPAFVDEAHDAYDQVIENLQRDDLKPMELALFIKKRLDAGDKKQDIAKRLSKDNATITQHLALIDPPSCIEEAYGSGKCTSPKTLYELRSLHEKYPSQVEAWCASSDEITRKGVSSLAEELKDKKDRAPGASSVPMKDMQDDRPESKFGHDQISSEQDPSDSSSTESEKRRLAGASKTAEDGERQVEVDVIPPSTGDLTSWEKNKVTDPDRMTKPLLLVEYDGRAAALILNRRPSKDGLLHIRFEDDGANLEVEAGACKINRLTDSP